MYTVKGYFAHCFMKVCGFFPIQNKIVFSSYNASAYADSPKIIYEKFLEKNNNKYKYIWLMNDDSIEIVGAEVIKGRTLKALYHLATAKGWVDNIRKPASIVKRKKQYYVQTWHANIGLKKVEADAVDKLSELYVKSAKNDSKMADLFLAGSKWASQNYRDAFWYDGKILEYGLPRSDIFYKEPGSYIKKVHEYYELDSDTKMALYAPTFRANGNLECYKLDYNKLLHQLQNRWRGEWKILVRLHPNIQNQQNTIEYNKDILNGSIYKDISELIIASDLLITDYSSCMFDAMEAGKKVMLFATDIEEYMADRGTYFSFEELPFLLAEDGEALYKNIEEFDEIIYEKKAKAFMKRCGFCNCANSTEKIVDYIIKQIS